MSAFEGMSIREMDGMPRIFDATAYQLSPRHDFEYAFGIADDQAEYVSSVYGRCPDWRWFKKRRLGRAVAHTRRIRRMLEFATGRRNTP